MPGDRDRAPRAVPAPAAPTFAELVADAKEHPAALSSAPPSPGRFNRDGDLFHPDGTLRRPEEDEIDADEARAATAPLLRGRGIPTWSDLWSGDGRTVVFAHGDVVWAGLA